MRENPLFGLWPSFSWLSSSFSNAVSLPKEILGDGAQIHWHCVGRRNLGHSFINENRIKFSGYFFNLWLDAFSEPSVSSFGQEPVTHGETISGSKSHPYLSFKRQVSWTQSKTRKIIVSRRHWSRQMAEFLLSGLCSFAVWNMNKGGSGWRPCIVR